MKRFNIQTNIGKAKYVVNSHDGEKKHPDGSDFYDIAIFKNKKDLARCVAGLKKEGYIENH